MKYTFFMYLTRVRRLFVLGIVLVCGCDGPEDAAGEQWRILVPVDADDDEGSEDGSTGDPDATGDSGDEPGESVNPVKPACLPWGSFGLIIFTNSGGDHPSPPRECPKAPPPSPS